jgi:uncharacterized protein (TIGR03663 family)
VSTTSTKSSPKKKAPAEETSGASPSVDGSEISELAWRLSSLGVLLVGAFLRLYHLSLVPLHHDEGVNGNFLVTLVREGKYEYNPENYHGPTLYFFSAVIPWLARFFGGKAFADNYGLTTFNIRLVTAAFGIGTIWLVLLLRKRIGTIGALSAAALLAISPGAVYLSRYFIHESLFVFFTLGIVVAALKYYDSGRATYLILAAISAALMVATKETWIINGPVLLIALITTKIYFLLRDKLAGKRSEGSIGECLRTTIERYGGGVSLSTVMLLAFAVFVLVNVLFYSSFFRNYPKGVSDAMKTLNLWRQRTHEHAHPFLQYFEWLRQMESPLLLLGGIGAVVAVWRAQNRLAVFVAQWAYGTLVAYSLVEYKTPWICLNFIVPLAIIGGYALDQLYRRFGEPWVPLSMTVGAIALLIFGQLTKFKYGDAGGVSGITWDFDFSNKWPYIFCIVLLAGYAGYILYSRSGTQKPSPHFYLAMVVALTVSGYQMYELNFVHYDDDQYAYVYAHTRRDLLQMLEEIDRISKRLGTGTDTGIAMVSPDYWPLPWYLRDYKRVGYYQKIVPTTEPIIIASTAQADQLKLAYDDRYVLVSSGKSDGSFALRPGVDLLLYVRKDVAK